VPQSFDQVGGDGSPPGRSAPVSHLSLIGPISHMLRRHPSLARWIGNITDRTEPLKGTTIV